MSKDETIEMLALLKNSAYTIDAIGQQDTGIDDVSKESFNFVIDETINLINYLSDHKTQWEEIRA